MRFSRFISGLAVAMAFVAGTASATPVPNMVINFTEQNGDVNAAYTGSVDLSGFTFVKSDTAGNNTSFLWPSSSLFLSLGANGKHYDEYKLSRSDIGVPFGTGGVSGTSISYGDFFFFAPYNGGVADVMVPAGYSQGTISGSLLFSSATFLSLGLTPGTYYQPIGNNTFEINVGSTPVPEIDPAGMGSVLALVTGALGVLERRRQKVA